MFVMFNLSAETQKLIVLSAAVLRRHHHNAESLSSFVPVLIFDIFYTYLSIIYNIQVCLFFSAVWLFSFFHDGEMMNLAVIAWIVRLCVCVQRGNTQPAHTVCQRSWLLPAVPMCVRLNKRSRWSPRTIRRESRSHCTTSRFRPSTSRATLYSANVRKRTSTHKPNVQTSRTFHPESKRKNKTWCFLISGQWATVRSHLLVVCLALVVEKFILYIWLLVTVLRPVNWTRCGKPRRV